MEILKPITLLSLAKKENATLELWLQIGPQQCSYTVPFQQGEFRLYNFPEALRRELRQDTAASWQLTATLDDYLDGNILTYPIRLSATKTAQLEAA